MQEERYCTSDQKKARERERKRERERERVTSDQALR